MPGDRYEYAKWQLTEKGNPEPLRKELARLEKTSTGAAIVEARELLAGDEGAAGGEASPAGD